MWLSGAVSAWALKWNMIEDNARCNKAGKEEDADSISGGIFLTAHRRAEERESKREIKNLWHHDPRMSAMSLPTTSQHIRVRVGITSRPITALEDRQGLLWNAWVKEGGLLTVQWASSVNITWRNPTNGSEIVPCCQKFLLKEKGEWDKDLN